MFICVALPLLASAPHAVLAKNPAELLRGKGETAVYFVFDGDKRHIPDPETFARMKFDSAKVKEVDANFLKSVREIEAYASLRGDIALVKVKGKPEVYHLKDGRRHHIPDYPTFTHLGLDYRTVQEFDESRLSPFPIGTNHSHIDTYQHLTVQPRKVDKTRGLGWIQGVGNVGYDINQHPEHKKKLEDRLRDFGFGNERSATVERLQIKLNGDYALKGNIRCRQVAGTIKSVTVRGLNVEWTDQPIVTYDYDVGIDASGNINEGTIEGGVNIGSTKLSFLELIALLL